MEVTVIFTCFNRKEKTVKCINSLVNYNSGIDFNFIIVDDNSSDGTRVAIRDLKCNVILILGGGNLYWAGGMRKGIEKYLSGRIYSNYVLLVNDDVEFFPNIVESMILESQGKKDAIIVGATCDEDGNFTYGAMQLIFPRKRDLYRRIEPSKKMVECDTFNCNCVLIKDDIIRTVGNFDPIYTHSMADLDYGLNLRRHGYHIYSSEKYIGVCEKNSSTGTWTDKTLSRVDRIKKKESPKGAPFKEWFHFMKKNFGLLWAFKYSISPYVRIILGK